MTTKHTLNLAAGLIQVLAHAPENVWKTLLKDRGEAGVIEMLVEDVVVFTANGPYDSQAMFVLYIEYLKDLHSQGWELPYNLTLEEIDNLTKSVVEVKPYYDY